MTKVICGYVAREMPNPRNWWLVKAYGDSQEGTVSLNNVKLPREYIGQRVRFKVEVLE